MRGVIMHSAGEVSVEEREDPRIMEPTDAVIRLSATCICGSDLWPYRGYEPVDHTVMGHEYCGVIEEVGSGVQTLKPGDFVVGSFVISDNTCEICKAGYQSKCVHAQFVHGTIGTQAERARIPYADGTLVKTPKHPEDDMLPSLLAASDVLGTGWFAAVAAEAGPGKTVAIVGDGAVGLLGVLAARTPSRPTAPSPTTATVLPGPTSAATAANQPVPSTSEAASRPGTRSSEGRSGVATRVPSASGMRAYWACAPVGAPGCRLTQWVW